MRPREELRVMRSACGGDVRSLCGGVAPGVLVAAPLAGLDRLHAHGWPGNVRELRNVIDRAIALAPGAARFSDLVIRIDAGPVVGADDALSVRSDLPFAEAKAAVLHDFERRYLADLLARTDHNLSAASRACGVDRKHLRTSRASTA